MPASFTVLLAFSVSELVCTAAVVMTPAMLLSQALQALFQPLQQNQSLVKEIMSHSLNEEVSQPWGKGGGQGQGREGGGQGQGKEGGRGRDRDRGRRVQGREGGAGAGEGGGQRQEREGGRDRVSCKELVYM